ncbi:nuclear transport factor 2 family protein [Rhodobacteraceae bacterium NNCM2]|nr:nuclear transport factor 2 family protein [Coraliihabitans acroporae]
MPLTVTAIRQMAHNYTAAWNSKSPEAVAAHFAEDGRIVINRGEASEGRDAIAAMAGGFFADVPDLELTCDDVRNSGNHVLFAWTFTGHDSINGNALTARGWEEWDLGADLKIRSSRGWFDADDYAQQIAGD